MKTRTQEEIISEVHKSIFQHRSSRQRFRQLKSILSKNDPRLVGDALLSYWRTLVDQHYEAQLFVASLLFALNPPTSISLSDILKDLTIWDCSVEEFPWYLALQFGKDTVLQELHSLVDANPEDETIMRAAETMRYCLKIDYTAAQANY